MVTSRNFVTICKISRHCVSLIVVGTLSLSRVVSFDVLNTHKVTLEIIEVNPNLDKLLLHWVLTSQLRIILFPYGMCWNI